MGGVSLARLGPLARPVKTWLLTCKMGVFGWVMDRHPGLHCLR
jgi:hypothetical protein